MKLITRVVLGLLLSPTIYAASFDCNKAATQVEKMICADAEVSRMDETMHAVYRSVLQDKKGVDALKQQQKQWVTERDHCSSNACLKQIYEKQLTLLKLPISTIETAKPIVTRNSHSATLLSTGKVLVAGGWQGDFRYLESAELYDPATGRFAATGKLVAHSRGSHLATRLPNGKVLVVGGEAPYEGHDPIGFLFSAELYDPFLGTFSETGSLIPSPGAYRLEGPTTATLLANGKILYAPLFMEDGFAQLYDPATGRFTVTGGFVERRAWPTATLLPSGKVLFAGGIDNRAKHLASAELYDPTGGTFKPTGDLLKARIGHTATLLPNGKVLVAGGQAEDRPMAGAELYDPATGRFTVTGQLLTMRVGHTATLLKNGKVLIAGGNGADGELVSLELYDPGTGVFGPAGRLIYARKYLSATLLQDGRVLFMGEGSAELYE